MAFWQLIINVFISYVAGVASALFVSKFFSFQTIGAVSFLSLSFIILYFVQRKYLSLAGISSITQAEPVKLIGLMKKSKKSIQVIGISMHTLFEESEKLKAVLKKKSKNCEIEFIFLDPENKRNTNLIDEHDKEPIGSTKKEIELHIKKVSEIEGITIRLHQQNLRWGAVIIDERRAILQPFIPVSKKTIYLHLDDRKFSIIHLFLQQYADIKKHSIVYTGNLKKNDI